MPKTTPTPKPASHSTTVNVRCSPQQKDQFLSLGGADWFRAVMDGDGAPIDVEAMAREPAVIFAVGRKIMEAARDERRTTATKRRRL